MSNAGFALGGFVKGAQGRRALVLQERDLDRRTFRDELANVQAQREAKIASQKEVSASIESNLLAAREYIGALDEAGADYTPEHLRGVIDLIRGDALDVAKFATARGLSVNTDLMNRRFDNLLLHPTRAQKATLDAQTEVAGQRAKEQALIEAGIDPKTARASAFGLEGQALKPTDVAQIENTLRDELDKQSQDFEAAQQNFLSMDRLAKDETGASDVALVFSFFKTVDPTSSVREGEFASAAQAAGLPAQFVQSFARLDSGEILPAQLRIDLVAAAGQFFEQRLTDQRNREIFYRGLAERSNVAPGNVVRSRIRFNDTGRFAAMTIEQLNAVDIDNLSDAEVEQIDKELTRRGR